MSIIARADSAQVVTGLKLKIRQIYYAQEHRAGLLEHVIPYYNPEANHFLENQVILDCFMKNVM